MPGSDVYSGSLDLLVLKAVSSAPMHGYAIGKWIRQSTNEGLCVQEGALYPALHRLQRRGFLAEQRGMTEMNRDAKFYKLTAAGRAQLKRETARWQAYTECMRAALAAKP